MKAYKIQTGFNYSQPHIVIADTMGEAEEIFKKEYSCEVLSIEKIADYVQVKESS